MNRAERRRQKRQATLTARRDKSPIISPSLQPLFELAYSHYESGQLGKAENACQKILHLEPKQPLALNLLGVIAHDLGKDEVAVRLIQRALTIQPNFASAHSNLGLAQQGLGQINEAIGSYRTSLRIKFDAAETHYNLGNSLRDLGNLQEAVSTYNQALTLNPELTEAHHALGVTLTELGRLNLAEKSFQNALLIKPNFSDALSSYGLLLIARKQWDKANTFFRKSLELSRGENSLNLDHQSFKYITKTKIKHDIEHFLYLSKIGIKTRKMADLASLYTQLSNEIVWPATDSTPVALSETQQKLLKTSYNRPFHLVETPTSPEPCLSPRHKKTLETEHYFTNSPGMTYIDNFLSPRSLEALRAFLTQSTIWYDYRYKNGYLGTSLKDGMACPLLFQISEELRKLFPDIFKHHLLQQAWAYKYDSQLGGINTHADFAAVNVNFWITPNSANLDPDRGGLIIYKKEAPLDWAFTQYNQDQKKIRDFLGQYEEDKMIVPYAENRAVIFNSDLFHETDSFHFKSGYLNRRINVTMLFGNRWE